ncbi:MAG: hypothetical protein U0003_02400 [Vampirovibrionales bacterium]
MTYLNSSSSSSSQANATLLAQWLLSNQAAAGQTPVTEGNQIPAYLLQSNTGNVEGTVAYIENALKQLGNGDFYDPEKYIKAAQQTNFNNNKKPVDLYGEAFLKPKTIVNKTKSLADQVLNAKVLPIGPNGVQDLSSVLNTGFNVYDTAYQYINPLDNSTTTNAFSTFVFTTVLGSLLTGTPSPLTPNMMTNALFGVGNGDDFQNQILNTSLIEGNPTLKQLTASQLNSKVLSDLNQSPLKQSVDSFLNNSGLNSPTSSATSASSSSVDASKAYGGCLSGDQLSMISETSQWLKQYKNGAGGNGSNTVSDQAKALAKQTSWLRQLQGLGPEAENNYQQILEKLLKGQSASNNNALTPVSDANESGSQLVTTLIESTIQQTLSKVLQTVLPKLQLLVQQWAKTPSRSTPKPEDYD